MSVINDMLRDLEQRKAAGRDGLNHAGTLPVVQAASPSSLRTWLLMLLVVLLALGLGIWFWKSTPASVELTPTAKVAEPQPVIAEAPLSASEPKKEATTNEVAAKPEQNSSPSPLTGEGRGEGEVSSQPAPPLPQPLSREGRGENAPTDPVVAETEPSLPKEQPTPQPNSQAPEPAQSVQREEQQTEAAPVLEAVELAPAVAVVDAAPRPVVSLTPQAQDQKQAAEAQALLRRGEIDTALRQLNQFIDQAEVDHRSRAVLVNYLLQYGRLAEAGDVLQGAPVDKDPDLRQLKARWLAVGGRPHEAVSLLESDKPTLATFPAYHALLASYYQQLGQAEPAAQVYAELVAHDPSQANWWAGRALALDRLARYDEAKVAYQRALVLPGLSGQLAQYAKQRILDL